MTKLIFDSSQEFEELMCSMSGNGDCDICGGCSEGKRCLKSDPTDWDGFARLYGSEDPKELEEAADRCVNCIFFYIDGYEIRDIGLENSV